MWDVTQLKFRH